MQGVQCQAGPTQIAEVLTRAVGEMTRRSVSALVFVGDAMEESPTPSWARQGA